MFGKTDPFLHLSIKVGPPEATLSVMELPPANYQVEVWSKVVRHTNGHQEFILGASPKTNAVTTPLPERGTIVLLHGYATQKESMVPWAILLAQTGYRVVLVDLRGHGHSTGRTFSAGKYETVDLIQVLDYLTARQLSAPQVGVLGYSFGANLGLYWAARDPRVKTVVAIAAFNQPEEAIPRFAKEMKWPFSTNKLQQAIALAEPKLGINWTDWTGVSAAAKIKEPIFFIAGGKDNVSPLTDLAAFKKVAPAGSNGIVIPEASHFVIGFWFQTLAKPVKEWFAAHLPPPAS